MKKKLRLYTYIMAAINQVFTVNTRFVKMVQNKSSNK